MAIEHSSAPVLMPDNNKLPSGLAHFTEYSMHSFAASSIASALMRARKVASWSAVNVTVGGPHIGVLLAPHSLANSISLSLMS
jgi:hypothetical protein